MGQYYHVITEDKNGVREYFNIQNKKWLESKKNGKPDYEHYNGLKLMEHSWWGNGFCNALASRLVDNPKNVAWVGDYAEEDECVEHGFSYAEVWEREETEEDEGNGYVYVDEDIDFKMEDVKYLVNNTTKTYVDLQEYHKECDRDGWCIFPISILTAIGNGRGGGDYHSESTDVGLWAFNEIYLTNDLPEGYEKDDFYFVEE